MTPEAYPIDVGGMPDVSRLVHEVNRTGRSRLILADGEVARLSPAGRISQERPERRRPFTRDDALFGLIGIGTGKTPGGVSGKKHETLARAYRPK